MFKSLTQTQLKKILVDAGVDPLRAKDLIASAPLLSKRRLGTRQQIDKLMQKKRDNIRELQRELADLKKDLQDIEAVVRYVEENTEQTSTTRKPKKPRKPPSKFVKMPIAELVDKAAQYGVQDYRGYTSKPKLAEATEQAPAEYLATRPKKTIPTEAVTR